MWIIYGHDHRSGSERCYQITGCDGVDASDVLEEFKRTHAGWVTVLRGPEPTHPMPASNEAEVIPLETLVQPPPDEDEEK